MVKGRSVDIGDIACGKNRVAGLSIEVHKLSVAITTERGA